MSKAIEAKIAELELADRLASKPRLTLEDVDEISQLVDEVMAKKFGARS